MPKTLEELQQEVLELKQKLTETETERDTLRTQNETLSSDNERIRNHNQHLFEKLTMQQLQPDESEKDPEPPQSCVEFAKTIKI